MNRESIPRKKDLYAFLFLHAALAGLLLLFPLYLEISSHLPKSLTACKIHELLHIYCPVCGMTRSLSYLLEGRFAQSFLSYPPLHYFILLFVCFDIRAFLCIVRGRRVRLPAISAAAWSLLAVVLSFFIIRNILLTVFHIDPLCDLIFCWL